MRFVGKRCDAAINDRSGLAARLAKLPNRDEFKVLAETVSNEPIGPIVAQGQPRWEAVVRFTLNALVAAEELGVTQDNVDAQRSAANPEVQRLLGATGDFGAKLGLANDWAYKAIKSVGATTARSGTAMSAPRRRCGSTADATRWSPTAAS